MTIGTLLIAASAPAWFGPATVEFSYPHAGNPFSPTENDIRVEFTNGRHRQERLAYFANGKWHATLAASVGGKYTAQLVANGRRIDGQRGQVTLEPARSRDFVRRDGKRFKLDTGKPYIPFGHNFGWQNGRDAGYPEQLRDMAKAGLNWTRVWANSWDTKNPFMPAERETKLPLGWMHEPALDRWAMVVDQCERNGIKFQFVLFHHGLYSSTTDSNWDINPWNRANGGFLARPHDFFTDAQAKTLTKAWLRYAVARWGHSTSVMAWELFNEVQWVDMAKEPGGWNVIADWHAEMAKYLRSIDPYHHLVTSSSEVDAKVYAPMDYEQPHTYPPSVYGALLGTRPPKDKPLFFGEYGGSGGRDLGKAETAALRDGFWGGLLAGHAGPGAYWFWDRIYRLNLYEEFAREASVLRRSGFADNPDAVPAPIKVTGAGVADLVVRPGRGWGKTDKFVYRLPEDAATVALPQLSGYIQGAKGGNRAMMAEPIRLRFNAPRAGEARIVIAQVARKGGAIEIRLNGANPAVAKAWPAGTADTRVGEELVVPFAAGPNEIAIDNPGEDWVTLDSIKVPGVGAGVSAVSLRSPKYALARLQWFADGGPTPKAIEMPGLRDGTYEMRQFDLDTGKERVTRVAVKGGRLAGYTPSAKDEGLVLLRR
ncbi:MAG: hypothetical protein ACO1SV_14355 [Fimbriimonas sp.]